MFEQINLYIEIKSPVHVGCDEVYEPFSFVVDEENKNLIVFDPSEFYSNLGVEDRLKFGEICKKGTLNSILEIYRFLKGRKANGKNVAVCKGFIEHYNSSLRSASSSSYGIQKSLNQFIIERTAHLHIDDRPYLPGSTIKGALRTAWLNKLSRSRNIRMPHGRSAHKILEKELMQGDFAKDPFRLVKVSDFHPVAGVETNIIYAVNEKKKPKNKPASGPYQMLEIINSGSIFTGSISLSMPLQGAGISKPVTWIELFDSIASFFSVELDRENNEISNMGCGRHLSIPRNSEISPLRIGRHSGAECLTIDGYRKISVKVGREYLPKNSSTTLWFASDHKKNWQKDHLSQFGWVSINLLSPDKKGELEKQESVWRSRYSEEMANQKKRTVAEREKLTLEKKKKEEKRRLEAEALRLIAEKERKQRERMANMSKEELVIFKLGQKETTANDIFQFYGELLRNNFDEGSVVQLAEAFKKRWIKDNKWRSKDCKKKQKLKVREIKRLLGE